MVESVFSTSVVKGGKGVYYITSVVTCSIYVVICSTTVDTEKKGRRTVLGEHARAMREGLLLTHLQHISNTLARLQRRVTADSLIVFAIP